MFFPCFYGFFVILCYTICIVNKEKTKHIERRFFMNQVILMGRLVKDPEIRMTKGNEPMKVANYVLAVNDGLKKNGEQDVDFINCVAFGRSAELAEKY